MAPSARPLAVAFGKAVLLLVLLAAAWSFIAPFYNRALATAAGPFTPSQVGLETEGFQITLLYRLHTLLGPRSLRMDSLTLQGGLLLVAALVTATPAMAWKHRAIWLAAVVAGFFLLHVATVAFLAWALQWSVTGRAVNVYSVGPIVPTVYVALPALVGGAWCWHYWLPALSSPAGLGEASGRLR